MKICSQCGAEINDSAKFCPKCGAVSVQPQAPQYSQPNNNQSFNAPGFNPNPNAYQQPYGQQQTQQQYQQSYGQQQGQYQQPYGQQYQQQRVYTQNTSIPPYQAPKTGNFFKDLLNTPDYTAQFDPADIQDCKGFTIASYFVILFWLPLAFKKFSRYGRFHANQALLAFIVSFAFGIVSGLLQLIIQAVFTTSYYYGSYFYGYYDVAVSPVGIALCTIVSIVLSLPSLAFLILGLINTINGRAKELPLIGKFRIFK